MLGLCRVLLRDAHEAEDAVQQTFLAAYRSLLNGNEPRHPAAWLATIARNECRARAQRRMREPLVEREPDLTLPDPVATAAARADLGEIWRAIGELPRRQRRVFLLREFSGLSYAELGEALALSEPAVESLLLRARRQLRRRLRPVYRSTAVVMPLVEIRDQLSRLIGDMSGPASSSGLARVASAPLVAKLAAGAAAVVVAGGTVEAVQQLPLRDGVGNAPAQATARRVPTPAPVASPVVRAEAASPARVRPRVRVIAAPTRRTAPTFAAVRTPVPQTVAAVSHAKPDRPAAAPSAPAATTPRSTGDDSPPAAASSIPTVDAAESDSDPIAAPAASSGEPLVPVLEERSTTAGGHGGDTAEEASAEGGEADGGDDASTEEDGGGDDHSDDGDGSD